MKRKGVLNSEIATVLARMGHTDSIAIGDCGLPIPERIKRIDLVVKLGSPSFMEVLSMILDDFEMEKATLASEIKHSNKTIYDEIQEFIKIERIDFIEHNDFKELMKNVKAVIRTGEDTPYANIILHSGVIFRGV
ncbi:D-ribose pyranase [Pseudalkalibacillus sp. R45]|uniref:D-ribose pyranase n=1 Tax=Pseudalkalibacillus sp. R45 TaxID=3457433 RepID=UPI003FCD1073